MALILCISTSMCNIYTTTFLSIKDTGTGLFVLRCHRGVPGNEVEVALWDLGFGIMHNLYMYAHGN
jgi:hypothetical protein